MTARPASPWFTVSVGMLCFMVGYAVHANLPGGRVLMNDIPSAPTPPAAAPVKPTAQKKTPPTVDDDPVIGSAKAAVTIIEFTDFQCPYCQRHFLQTYPQIKKDYVDAGSVRYVVRDFPLGIHPNAPKAGEAGGCAQEQGKFWEMHDKLFTGLATWKALPDPSDTFKGYAKDIGLNAAAFAACLDGGKKKEEVQKDMADGIASGVSGTPGFWLIGGKGEPQFISGAASYTSFKQAIEARL